MELPWDTHGNRMGLAQCVWLSPQLCPPSAMEVMTVKPTQTVPSEMTLNHGSLPKKVQCLSCWFNHRMKHMNGNMGLRAYRSHRNEALTPNGHMWLLNERERVLIPSPRQGKKTIPYWNTLCLNSPLGYRKWCVRILKGVTKRTWAFCFRCDTPGS